MARKKCPHCRSCYTVFWVEGTRYYSCWLCQKVLFGRDDDLKECEDPRRTVNLPMEEMEQEDEPTL